MDHHDIFFDKNYHIGDIRISTEDLQQRKLISKGNVGSRKDLSNSKVQDGSDDATPDYKFVEQESKRKRRIDLHHLQKNHRAASARNHLKRQRRPYLDCYGDQSTRCSLPENIVNQNQSSLQEHPTMNVTCSDISSSSLGSNSTGSFSTQEMLFRLRNHSCSGEKIQHNMKRLLIEAIRERFRFMLKDTELKPNGDKVLLLHPNDVIPVHPYPLGAGTFSRVTRIAIRSENGTNLGENNKEYACKKLKQELLSNPKDYIKAATELAYEAYILSCLDHQNIIKLRGHNSDGIASFADVAGSTHESLPATFSSDRVDPPTPSFFLILDFLQETLDQRIERWRTNDRPMNMIEILQRSISKISICRQLASALEYLHSKRVVFRDLKPQNIGFCEKDGEILKLFDFGLSRELPHSIANADENNQNVYKTNENMSFDLSGLVGTIRYMAPEVCLGQPYNWACDIYSWSIVAWEIWSQTKPFAAFTPDLYQNLVCRQGYRPTDRAFNSCLQPRGSKFNDVTTFVPPAIEFLLKQAWKREPHQRIRWSGIQCHLDGFQISENLHLKETIRTWLQFQVPEGHPSI